MTNSQADTATLTDETTSLEFGIDPYRIPAGELANAIERFRQQEQRSDDYRDGHRVGTEWCLHQASLAELRSVATADTRNDFSVTMRGIARLLMTGRIDEHEVFRFWKEVIPLTTEQLDRYFSLNPTGIGTSFAKGFREAAQRMLRIVQDRI